MLAPKKCEDVSPQCPDGQEDTYRLGWWQGQIEMCDRHDGTPCQVISMQQEIDMLRTLVDQYRNADPMDLMSEAIQRINAHNEEAD